MRFAGFRVVELQAPAGLRVPLHQHSKAYLRAILRGELLNDPASRRNEQGKASQAVFHPDGTAHSSRIGGTGAHSLRIEFEADWLHATASGTVPRQPLVLAAGHQALIRGLSRELRSSLPCAGLMVEGICFELVAALVRTEVSSRAELERARLAGELLRADCARQRSLSEVALAVGLEPAKLNLAFQRRFGRSVAQYLRELRVRRVGELLRQGMPIAEAAVEAGFCDQAHCTRVFKAVVGCTPGRYREDVTSPRRRGLPRHDG